MPLTNVSFEPRITATPNDVQALVDSANQCADDFSIEHPFGESGFVASDFQTVYFALKTIAESNLTAGNAFCEWGSGIGVVTLMASLLGFDAIGIEIDERLVDESRAMSERFGIDAEFIHGSFVPPGAEAFAEQACADLASDFLWLDTRPDDTYDAIGMSPDDFDLIFAYPWPGEEQVLEGLFDRYSRDGALLLTYNQFDSVRLWRRHPARHKFG